MKKLTFAIFLAMIWSFSLIGQTAEEIIQKHYDAIGGKDRWSKINDIRINAHMQALGQKIKMGMIMKKSSDSVKSRVDVEIMGKKMITVVDGDNSWVILPRLMGGNGQKKMMSKEEISASSKDQSPPGMQLITMFEKGDTVKLGAMNQINGKSVYNIIVTSSERPEITTFYLDSKTYLISQIKTTQDINGDLTEIALDFGDYKTTDGLTYAGKYTTMGPMGPMDIFVDTMEINKGIEDTLFTQP